MATRIEFTGLTDLKMKLAAIRSEREKRAVKMNSKWRFLA